MQYVNVIFEQHPETSKARFAANPDLEQTFIAALAGCNLVLSCLDDEAEKTLAKLGPEHSKGRKEKARMLWREDSMKDLLQTLRGQHAAIFSIIQCLQLQNVAQLDTKIDELRVILENNHPLVERAVGSSQPLDLHCVGEGDDHDEKVSLQGYHDDQLSTKTASSGHGSTEKLAKSYRHYRATISNISKQPSRSSLRNGSSYITSNNTTADETASIAGIAPSTVFVSHSAQDREPTSERDSLVSAASVSLRTREWLEAVSSAGSSGSFRRPLSLIPSTYMSTPEIENAIVASDLSTFVEHIRYFMPALHNTQDEGGACDPDGALCEDDSTVLIITPDTSVEGEQAQKGEHSTKIKLDSNENGTLEAHNTATFSGDEPGLAEQKPHEIEPNASISRDDEMIDRAQPQNSLSSLFIHSAKRDDNRSFVVRTATAKNLRVNHGFSQALASPVNSTVELANPSINKSQPVEDTARRRSSILLGLGVSVVFVSRPEK